jgi:hypothetical protein
LAAPNYSPGPGQPTTYTDANGTTYQYDRNSGFWQQMSSGANVNSAVNTITGGNQVSATGNTLAETGNVAPLNLPADWSSTTPYSTFYAQALLNPDLVAYYTTILNQSNGDLDLAKKRLEQDYQIGTRNASQDLEATLSKLGLTFTNEANTLRDTLNKRGVALTQTTPGVAGITTYAGGGQPQTELTQLTEDQKLRKEAEQRTADRALETAGITKQRGIENLTTQQRDYLQQQELNKRAEARDIASQQQAQETATKSSQLTQAQIEQQNKQLSGGTTSNTSSNWMDYYKGWNPSVAQADYNAVYGGNLSKLQASKPL